MNSIAAKRKKADLNEEPSPYWCGGRLLCHSLTTRCDAFHRLSVTRNRKTGALLRAVVLRPDALIF